MRAARHKGCKANTPWIGYRDKDHSRACTLRFALADDAGEEACLHGFAGFFDSQLHGAVRISTVPATHTPGMHSWFPMFFPLRHPVLVRRGDVIEVGMWRVVSGSKVWRRSACICAAAPVLSARMR